MDGASSRRQGGWRLPGAVLLALGGMALLAGVGLVALLGEGHRHVLVDFIPGQGDDAGVVAPASTPARLPRPVNATAVGDSVLLAAADVLSRDLPGMEIDAVVGRGVTEGISVLRRHAANGGLGDTVVVHLGTNGEFTDEQFEEIAAIVGPQRRLVFVTVRVPRTWEAADNDVITRGVARHPNAVLVDWRGASAGQPGLVWDDGIHLRPEGVAVYAALIVGAFPP